MFGNKKKTKIILKSSGGLGNQLFQYLYAKAIAEDKNIFITTAYHNYLPRNKLKAALLGVKRAHNRNFVIDKIFEIDKRTITNKPYSNLLNIILKFSLARFNLISRLLKLLGNIIIVEGYFTKQVYFNKTLEYVETLTNLNKPNKKINKCAVHIRAGDLLYHYYNQNLSTKYLQNAMSIIHSNGVNHFVIISEDKTYAKQVIDKLFLGEDYSISFARDGDEVEHFKLICKHNYIICWNSTFSYMACVLGKPKLFITPKYFYKLNDKPRCLINEIELINE